MSSRARKDDIDIIHFFVHVILKEFPSFVDCCSEFTSKPENGAYVVGTQIQLSCQHQNHSSAMMSWSEYATNEFGQLIYLGTQSAHPPNEMIYRIHTSADYDYNLQIDLIPNSGGKFGCAMMLPYHTMFFAHVIVLGEPYQSKIS